MDLVWCDTCRREWLREWLVAFEGEPGIDCGGVRRELYTKLAQCLFAPESGMFVQLSARRQACHVMPTEVNDGHRVWCTSIMRARCRKSTTGLRAV